MKKVRWVCQDFGDSGYPAIKLQVFGGFGVDDDARDICWARYIRVVAGLNKHDYIVMRSSRGKLLQTRIPELYTLVMKA